jgi:cytoskeleton protein RodZ
MESRTGAILREARNRRKIDLEEVEAATRIRVRYLRAIENEEWEVLPGGVYTRGFIRTYAAYLGLDGERLAEDYRRSVEGAGSERSVASEPAAPAGPAAPRPPRSPRELPRAGWIAVAAVLAIAVLAITLLPGSGDGGGGESSVAGKASQQQNRDGANRQVSESQAAARGVSMRLAASAEVWVCVLDAKGEHLVDGQILEAGAAAGPFRSGSFTVSFGNGGVSMLIDGKEAEIPATSSPIGYTIDSSGELSQLSESERPTCT